MAAAVRCQPRRRRPCRAARAAAKLLLFFGCCRAVVVFGAQDVGLLKHISEVSMCEYSIIFLSKHGCPVGTVGGSAQPTTPPPPTL